uniref:N-acetyltransferase domain-containing protein n=1 Tax=Prymnesium polylepis TaxID=72548 RepID=A0A7S4JM75_9EUKA
MMSNLVVAPSHRRRGIGTRLLREVEASASSWGFDEMILMVDVDNESARDFYDGAGYRVVAEDNEAERPGGTIFSRVRWLRTTRVCMRKDGLPERLAEELQPRPARRESRPADLG